MPSILDRTISLGSVNIHYRQVGEEGSPPRSPCMGFTLIGHSMGGTVAYLFAEKWPERIERLVCEDTAPPSVADASIVDSFAGDDEDEQPAGPLPFDEAVWGAIIAQLRRPRRISHPLTYVRDGHILVT